MQEKRKHLDYFVYWWFFFNKHSSDSLTVITWLNSSMQLLEKWIGSYKEFNKNIIYIFKKETSSHFNLLNNVHDWVHFYVLKTPPIIRFSSCICLDYPVICLCIRFHIICHVKTSYKHEKPSTIQLKKENKTIRTPFKMTKIIII